jgi:hypothetical protein
MPVFRRDILAWATEVVRDSVYAASFLNGEATIGWYQRFMSRHGFVTGAERPLEMTRAKWMTKENLETYNNIAADVLVKKVWQS